jgi:two-component system invasion response regulator UvrY
MKAQITVLLVDDHAVVREGYRRLLEESGRIRVIGEAASATEAFQQFCILTPNVVVMRRSLDAGAAGYLTKASAPRVLVEAVDAVAAGKRFLSQDVATMLALLRSNVESTACDALSVREFEVLKLLVEGSTIVEIAEQLGLNQKTIANLQSSIKEKLGAVNSAQLIRAAMRLGLVPPI